MTHGEIALLGSFDESSRVVFLFLDVSLKPKKRKGVVYMVQRKSELSREMLFLHSPF